MTRRRIETAAAAIAIVLAAGLAIAQPSDANDPSRGRAAASAPATPAPAAPARPTLVGYLSAEGTPDGHAILSPAPQPGSARYEDDRRVFRETRALEGSPRWSLAQSDNDASIAGMMSHFSCALGVQLTPAQAPRLAAMMRRIALDHSRITNVAKDLFQRHRPYLIDTGNICIARNTSTDGSFDYPSGHAGWGWEWGLVLAEIAPDRATAVMVRARSFGESRVVCGVHNASTLDAARMAGSSLMAAEHGNAQFRADLEAARAEMAALRPVAARPEMTACQSEAVLTAFTPW